MRYGIQTATNEQTRLFVEEQTTKPKQASVPIYRVTLVREGKLPCYEQRIRSSAIASTILHNYLNGVDREHFVILLLDQKNQVIGINTLIENPTGQSVNVGVAFAVSINTVTQELSTLTG